jgi:hypothetical protein
MELLVKVSLFSLSATTSRRIRSCTHHNTYTHKGEPTVLIFRQAGSFRMLAGFCLWSRTQMPGTSLIVEKERERKRERGERESDFR